MRVRSACMTLILLMNVHNRGRKCSGCEENKEAYSKTTADVANLYGVSCLNRPYMKWSNKLGTI